MKAGWQRKRLGDLLEIQNGFAFDSESFSDSGKMPLIRIRDLKKGIDTEIRYTGEFDEKYVVNAGDLLIGMDGEFRCYEWKGKQALLNQRVCRLQKFKGSLFDRFVFYGINKYLKDIEEATGFTTVKHLSSKKISDINFPIPPLSEQRRIVAILDEAFAGIAAAKEKAEQNLNNAKEVFESAINSIEGKKVNLGDYVEIKTGKLDANAAEENGKYPFFTCSREIFSINNFSFDCEAILLAGNNAVGDFNVKYFNGKFNAYQRTYVITANNKRQILCKYLYIQLLNSLKKFKEKSVGAATKFLKLGMIKEMQIILPSLLEQETIISYLSCIQERTEKLESIYQQKLSNLEELKKSLLQQAFSGAL